MKEEKPTAACVALVCVCDDITFPRVDSHPIACSADLLLLMGFLISFMAAAMMVVAVTVGLLSELRRTGGLAGLALLTLPALAGGVLLALLLLASDEADESSLLSLLLVSLSSKDASSDFKPPAAAAFSCLALFSARSCLRWARSFARAAARF